MSGAFCRVKNCYTTVIQCKSFNFLICFHWSRIKIDKKQKIVCTKQLLYNYWFLLYFVYFLVISSIVSFILSQFFILTHKSWDSISLTWLKLNQTLCGIWTHSPSNAKFLIVIVDACGGCLCGSFSFFLESLADHWSDRRSKAMC